MNRIDLALVLVLVGGFILGFWMGRTSGKPQSPFIVGNAMSGGFFLCVEEYDEAGYPVKDSIHKQRKRRPK